MSESHTLMGEPIARASARLTTQEGASMTTPDVTVFTGPTFKQQSLAGLLQQMGVATASSGFSVNSDGSLNLTTAAIDALKTALGIA